MQEITSITNPKIQFVKKLVKSKSLRKDEGLIVVEGVNILKDLPSFVEVNSIFVDKDKVDEYANILSKYTDNIKYYVTSKVIDSMADTQTSPGIIFVVKVNEPKFSDGNFVVLDGVSDPGNLGTILRTCTACDVKNIISINCVDYTSPKVIRSSLGCIFKVNIIEMNHDDALEILKDKNILSLDMKGENIYSLKTIKKPFALVVGNEAHGISKILKDRCNQLISLPMIGEIESLNAGVSLSVALYQLTFGI